MSNHLPVLVEEILEFLDPKRGENFIDCTFGSGGHSKEILKHILPEGKILGIDAETVGLEKFQRKNSELKNNLILINDNFVNLKDIYERFFYGSVDGILFDLGLSTNLLEDSGRGFSFKRDEPLDMRFNANNQRLTAAEVLNNYSFNSLVEIFRDFGEYPQARRLAKIIFERRKKAKFKTTKELVKAVADGNPRSGRQKIHPATKVFQALRIEVNHELDVLPKALSQAFDILQPGGRLAVISFHSLEDRIVKNFFRSWARENKAKLASKKPVTASQQELEENPKSRSAKLRAIIKE